jgi:anti-anti-sigma factor
MRLADLQIEEMDQVVLARLDGELDMSNASELGTAIPSQVTNEALGVVIDLTNVTYIDSAGIHILFELRGRLKDRGQETQLVMPPDAPVAAALKIVGIPPAVGVSETMDAAVETVTAGTRASSPQLRG